MNRKLKSLLSLCQRANLLSSGELSCETAIKKNKAKLILLSKEASAGTTKKFNQSAFHYKVPLYVLDCTKVELGGMIGKEQRSVIAILDDGFMNQIEKCVQEENTMHE